jgi:hypothetical protein
MPRNLNKTQRAAGIAVWIGVYTIVVLGFTAIATFLLLVPTMVGALIGLVVGYFAPFVVQVLVGAAPGLAGIALWKVGGAIGFLLGLFNFVSVRLSKKEG